MLRIEERYKQELERGYSLIRQAERNKSIRNEYNLLFEELKTKGRCVIDNGKYYQRDFILSHLCNKHNLSLSRIETIIYDSKRKYK